MTKRYIVLTRDEFALLLVTLIQDIRKELLHAEAFMNKRPELMRVRERVTSARGMIEEIERNLKLSRDLQEEMNKS